MRKSAEKNIDQATKVTGVHFEKRSGKYVATIRVNGKTKSLGRYRAFEEAVNARKAAEEHYRPNIEEHKKEQSSYVTMGVGEIERGESAKEVEWDDKFLLLWEFCEKNGYFPTQRYVTENGVNLGAWYQAQKAKLKNRKDLLASYQFRMLKRIGVTEPVDADNITWEEWFELAKKYKRKYGDVHIPQNFVVNGAGLGAWWHNQKCIIMGAMKKNDFKKKRKLLINFGIESDIGSNSWKDKRWNVFYELACKFHEYNGHLIIPFKHNANGKALGAWINQQRNKKVNGELTQDKILKLEQIGMVWMVRGHRRDNQRDYRPWDEKIKDIQEFISANKRFPSSSAKEEIHGEKKMYAWYLSQNYKLEKLDERKREIIKELIQKEKSYHPTRKRGKQRVQWDEKYTLAKDYFEKNGHLNLKTNEKIDGVNINAWVRTQKYTLNHPDKSGVAMTPDRIDKLSKIGIHKREQS